MKVVFLLGAGASKGSEDNGILTPPLGSDLFSQLQTRYPRSWGRLDVDSFGADFETAMSELIQKQPDSIDQLQRNMAEYFFGFQPTGANLYLRLIRELSSSLSSTAFVTLNYDLLLERSLLKAGLQPFCDAGKGVIEICLPHGCSHLWIDGFRGPLGSIKFHPSADAFNGPVRAFGSRAQFQDQIDNNPLPPVMSCFDTAKITPTAKQFVQQQRARIKELIAGANLVLIIGVRIREHDKHLWEPLATTFAGLLYCAGQTGAHEFESWREESRIHTDDRVLPGYFSHHFGDIVYAAKSAAAPILSG